MHAAVLQKLLIESSSTRATCFFPIFFADTSTTDQNNEPMDA